jgi:hypothetical protein
MLILYCPPCQFAPEEWIYRAGEMAYEMYFVASGVVEELGERDKVITYPCDFQIRISGTLSGNWKTF